VLCAGPAAATTEVEGDVDGGPLGVLLAGPVVATTEVEKDVDGGPPGRCCRQVRQRPPPKLKETSMEGCLGGAASQFGRGP
jgi:hypothetical protein